MAAGDTIKEDVMQMQILQAARLLFQKHGYQKVTMDDVARAIGKGRSSLYYYYKSKDEIFDAVMAAEVGDFIAELSRAIDAEATTEENIYSFFMAKIKAARKRKAFFSAVEEGMDLNEISQYAKKKQVVHKNLIKGESSLLRNVILSGMKRGELPKLEDKRLDTVVYVLLCGLHGLKREMLLENDFSRAEAAMSTLAHMAIQAIKQ